VASAVRQVVSEAIARRLSDPRIAPLTTVTEVTMSRDLQIATVLVSVAGSEADERKTLRALQHARGHLQKLVGQNLQLRRCPELRIRVDKSVRKVRETLRLIEANRAESDGDVQLAPSQKTGGEQDGSGQDGGQADQFPDSSSPGSGDSSL